VQIELAQVLADEGDHAGVVRAGAQFAEDHFVFRHEKLHAEQACAA
jgi:hypothetical protein